MRNKFIAGLTLVGAATWLLAAPPQSHTYTGQIMDSACAAKGSHAAMMKQEGTGSAKDCTLACAKAGNTLVLYNASNQRTYQLDDQSKANDFAGAKVRVTGTYDTDSKTIHVSDIKKGS